jgi:hypothetical protein
MHWLKRLLTPPLIVLAAILMWVEEWLWEHLKVVTAWIAKFPLLRWYEAGIQRLPPYPTMLMFLLPGTILLPVKVFAVWLVAHGRPLLGIGVIVAAKVVGTAVAARSYVICKPKLMTIRWFARLHDWLIAARDYLYARVAAMPLYQAVRARLTAWRIAMRELLTRFRARGRLSLRWRAIRRWLGKRQT